MYGGEAMAGMGRRRQMRGREGNNEGSRAGSGRAGIEEGEGGEPRKEHQCY